MYITFCIITMFIGFLLSQWQRSHLPTAAARLRASTSAVRHWERLKAANSSHPTSSSLRDAIQDTFPQTILDWFSYFFDFQFGLQLENPI